MEREWSRSCQKITVIMGENDIHIAQDSNGQVEGSVNLLVNGDVNLRLTETWKRMSVVITN